MKKNSSTSEMNFNRASEAIASAARGLTYISETDAAFEPLEAAIPRSRTRRAYLDAIGIERTAKVEEVRFDEFFARLTINKEWHTARDRRRAREFTQLRETINEYLSDVKVLRVGRVNVDIYIVGLDAEGRLVGLKTRSVET